LQLKQDNHLKMENIKIIEEKENPLFSRKEITLEISAEITPKREDAEKIISEKKSVLAETIDIKKIFGKFGSKTFKIIAHIYSSKDEKEKNSPKKLDKSKKPKE